MNTPTRYLMLPLLLLLSCWAQCLAQIDVRLEPVRREYLLGETAAVRLIITNYTDSPVQLSGTPERSWLYLSVTRSGASSTPLSPVHPPRFPDIKVMPGSRRAYTFELQPLYRLNYEGLYRISATLRMPDQHTTYTSNSVSISMSPGATVRSFTVQVRGQRLQMNVKMLAMEGKTMLFGQVVNPDTRIALGACMLAQYLNFMEPRVLLDRAQNLHVLCQSTAEFYTYAVMDTNGARRELKLYKRAGGPVDLVSTGSGIRTVGLAPYVKNTKPNSQYHSATERP